MLAAGCVIRDNVVIIARSALFVQDSIVRRFGNTECGHACGGLVTGKRFEQPRDLGVQETFTTVTQVC